MQSHYVITYDHTTGKFEMDADTLIAHFPDGTIYDENCGWFYPEENSTFEEDEFMGSTLLEEAIEKLNKFES